MYSFVFWVIVLAILVAYLGTSIFQRERTKEIQRRERERQRPGNAFDVSAIAPQIEHVRGNHLSAIRPPRHDGAYRTGLIATARRMVSQLSFFRNETHTP